MANRALLPSLETFEAGGCVRLSGWRQRQGARGHWSPAHTDSRQPEFRLPGRRRLCENRFRQHAEGQTEERFPSLDAPVLKSILSKD